MEMEQPMRIFCLQNKTVNAAVRDNKVILVRADPRDKSQHWYQDYSAIGNLTDDEGRRAFALVNRTTGLAMANNHGEPANTYGSRDVKLSPYSSHVAVELSKLWSLGVKRPDGFSSVRVLQETDHTLNALNGHAREGTVLGTYPAEQTENSLWKIAPINE